MSTLVKVARYHLMNPVPAVVLPLGIGLFVFLVNLAVFAIVPDEPDGVAHSGAVATVYVYLFVAGAISVAQPLPFGLTLGLSRRTYYLGTVALACWLGVVYATGIAAFYIVEIATNGWGIENQLHFFRIPWLFDGPWYLTWVTSFVILVLMFIYGMWFGLVYRRWNVVGLVTFIATQVVVLLAAALIITWMEKWQAVGEFFSNLTVVGLTGVLALIAVALATGGFVTLRRVTV